MHTFKDIRCRHVDSSTTWGTDITASLRPTTWLAKASTENDCFLWTWHVLLVVIDIRGQVAKYLKCCLLWLTKRAYIHEYVWDTWKCNESLRWAFRLSQTVATNMCLEDFLQLQLNFYCIQIVRNIKPHKRNKTHMSIFRMGWRKKNFEANHSGIVWSPSVLRLLPNPIWKKNTAKGLPCSSPMF